MCLERKSSEFMKRLGSDVPSRLKKVKYQTQTSNSYEKKIAHQGKALPDEHSSSGEFAG